MDGALAQLQCECSSTEYKNAIKMLYVYIKNIHEHSSMEKYRKIRIGNEKFNSNVWCHETCRTILLLTGFEQVGEFIELSSNADVSHLYNLLQKQMSEVDPSYANTSPSKQSPVQRNTTLSLAASNQGGIFSADVKADLTLLSYMVEMGYSKHASERGLIATKNQGVQPAMDWIAEHPECHVAPEQDTSKVQESTPSASVSTSSSSDNRPNVTSRLRNANEQKLAYQEKLRLEAIKKAKLDKAEDQMAKKYLVKNLQSERQESKEKFEREKVIRHVEVEEQEKNAALPPTSANMCVLRIRMHNGKVLIWETAKETSVKDLYSHVTELVNDVNEEFHVCIPHPHEVLDAEDETSLQEKGLYPKATVVVQKLKQDIPVIDEDSNTTASSEDTNINTDVVPGGGEALTTDNTNMVVAAGEAITTDVDHDMEDNEPVGET